MQRILAGQAEARAGLRVVLQQAARVADVTAFFSLSQADENGDRSGVLVEYDATQKMFTSPSDQRTEDYVTGRFG